MSAQACLDGIAAPAPDVLPWVAITGVLAGPSELRTMTNGDLMLQVLVQQQVQGRPHALPVLVSRVWHAQGAEHITYQLAHDRHARLMRAGIEVLAVGAGIEATHHHGRDVLRLLECSLLQPAADHPGHADHQRARQAHAHIVHGAPLHAPDVATPRAA